VVIKGLRFRKIKMFAVVSAVLTLTACASTPSGGPVIASTNLDSLKVLEDIAIEARHELRLLAKMKEAQSMKIMTDEQHAQRSFQALVVPPGFERMVDLDITDKAEKVAEAVALMAGYEFTVVGDSDGHDVIVNLHLSSEPLNEALRELGAQTADLATINVDQNSGKIFYEHTARRNLSNMPSSWGN
jgi:hypothetical protein